VEVKRLLSSSETPFLFALCKKFVASTGDFWRVSFRSAVVGFWLSLHRGTMLEGLADAERALPVDLESATAVQRVEAALARLCPLPAAQVLPAASLAEAWSTVLAWLPPAPSTFSALSTAAAVDDTPAHAFDEVRLSADLRTLLLRLRDNEVAPLLIPVLEEAFSLVTVSASPLRAAAFDRIMGLMHEARVALSAVDGGGESKGMDPTDSATPARTGASTAGADGPPGWLRFFMESQQAQQAALVASVVAALRAAPPATAAAPDSVAAASGGTFQSGLASDPHFTGFSSPAAGFGNLLDPGALIPGASSLGAAVSSGGSSSTVHPSGVALGMASGAHGSGSVAALPGLGGAGADAGVTVPQLAGLFPAAQVSAQLAALTGRDSSAGSAGAAGPLLFTPRLVPGSMSLDVLNFLRVRGGHHRYAPQVS
jgi:hypothetical protein